MTGPSASPAVEVYVEHHMFYLLDEGAVVHPPSWSPNGVIVSEPGVAVIFTGVSSGYVNVVIETLRHTPPSSDTHLWDEIIEHSVVAPTGYLRVMPMDGDVPDLPVLTPDGPGEYRLRVHARGRDIAPDDAVLEPVEDYLIQVWSAPAAADTIHQQRDRCGAGGRRTTGPAFHPSTDAGRPELLGQIAKPRHGETSSSVRLTAYIDGTTQRTDDNPQAKS